MLRCVKGCPCGPVDVHPLFSGHSRMMHHCMLAVVKIQVSVHPLSLAVQGLMILGSGQRRKTEKLQEIERKFFLDDLEIFADRIRSVERETKDVTGNGDDSDALP